MPVEKLEKDGEEIVRDVERLVSAAKKISREAEIAERFNLSDEQMSIFDSAFALYLERKRNTEGSYMAGKPEYEEMRKFPVLGFIGRLIMQNADRGELTEQRLERQLKNKKDTYVPPEGGIGPTRLVNAANYLSTKYLEDSHG